ncbi:TMV resistance protein N isoform X1 [Cucumis melo]|uniref:TMV resistance protein N isoform X1 n=2 Tax=Cucumis melo TaxID=3656 RepID=A0A1S3C9Z0_CUCME|nr:TMV resistance protein N isoform X1 [Cucumis melo]
MSFDSFISFRGEDTRNTFTGHLYKELVGLGITTFMDDKKLLIGDSLSEKLIKAIENSDSFIVVLSENYASSKWCLRELAKIIDCTDEQKHRVLLPVFYHVNPRDVRRQSGCFENSFRLHEELLRELDHMERDKYMEEVQQWRRAFTKVGDLTGVVVTKDCVEVDSIGKITNQLLDMLLHHQKLVPWDELTKLVDIERQLFKMEKLNDLEPNVVRFIGIIGMGGIGKTTIAEVFYDRVARFFGKNRCFLRIYEHTTLLSLQQQLLSQLLQTKDLIINNENEGARMIGSRLKDKRVLIVLDGVKEKTQLEQLVGNPNWFGSGSKIIITTRNRDVLRQPNYKDKMVEYSVEFLDTKSAMTLFCKHAFGCGFPSKNFEDFSKEIVERVEGHPQALIQIGSSLYDKGIEIWKEELKSLEEDYNNRIFKTLKISFDDLGKTSQEVFLDLACFFNEKTKEKVIEILKSFDYRPHSEIQLLQDRCLIEVRSDNTILMPKCIQTMGQQIEREADKRSRIWLPKDAQDVFDEPHRVKDIKGVVLKLEEKQDEIELEGKVFEDMRSLKILEIGNVEVSGDFTHLSKQLRLLNWHSYPSQCLPLSFESRYLFQLLLPLSQTRQLWNGQKGFEKLKVINVSGSKNLRETPNFTKVPNLESLDLSNCTRLWKIDSSISRLNRLTLLDITCCINLKNLSFSRSCKSLITINYVGSGLEEKGLDNFQNDDSQLYFQPKRRSVFGINEGFCSKNKIGSSSDRPISPSTPSRQPQ